MYLKITPKYYGELSPMLARVGEALLIMMHYLARQTGFAWHTGLARRLRASLLATTVAVVTTNAAAQGNPAAELAHLTDIIAVAATDEDQLTYNFIQQQIYRGESEQAVDQLRSTVDQIQTLHHRYHQDLVVPLTLLGDALMVQQDYDAALDNYDRARHVARVSFGLFDPRQVPVVYREAEARRKSGDLQLAGQREEYAFEVVRKVYDKYDPRVLPAIYRLAGFYLETYNILSARALYQYALQTHEANGTEQSIDAIPALRGIALTHRLERFPTYYTHLDDNQPQGPTIGIQTRDLDQQYVSFNNFPAGERALQQIVAIRREQNPQDMQETFNAILELADWHLMFGRARTANTLYSHVFEEMLHNGDDSAAFFAEPELIYFPRPSDPVAPPPGERDSAEQGYVTLRFSVGTNGRVRSMDTIDSKPPRLMDFKVRRSMRYAIYRPRLTAPGEPANADDLTFTHSFEYFPKSGDEEDDGDSEVVDIDDTDTAAQPAEPPDAIDTGTVQEADGTVADGEPTS